jgi:hypothetical protein
MYGRPERPQEKQREDNYTNSSGYDAPPSHPNAGNLIPGFLNNALRLQANKKSR